MTQSRHPQKIDSEKVRYVLNALNTKYKSWRSVVRTEKEPFNMILKTMDSTHAKVISYIEGMLLQNTDQKDDVTGSNDEVR